MLKNYLKIALRNLRKYKSYAAINVIGLAGCFLIMLYVRFEMSYENMHAQRDDIYRVVTRWMSEDVEMAQVWTPTGLAPNAAAKFSEIKTATLWGLAFIIACPLAYVSGNQWLQGFAYRVELGPGLFAVAGLLAFLCAALTVSLQAFKAALANPVETLRYE